MLQDVIHPPQQDDVSSPISPQILDFCGPEIFQETLKNSEVTSSSNCCHDDNSSYTTNLSGPPDTDKFSSCQDNSGSSNTASPTATTAAGSTTASSATTVNNNNINNGNNSNLSIIFGSSPDELDNDISASIDFSPSPTFPLPEFVSIQQDQFEFSSVQPQLSVTDVASGDGFPQYHTDPVVPLMVPPVTSIFDEDCLSSVPSYVQLNPSSPSCSFLGLSMSASMAVGTAAAALSADKTGLFPSGMLISSELQPQEFEYQSGSSGLHFPVSIHRVLNPGDLQALSNETQQLVGGTGSSIRITSEISSLGDSTFKVGKLSVEQRKEKIHRYLKKRNERNFSKKIKYACRKTLADRRPRVRGRFAKNDDFGEVPRAACCNHEEDDDEVVVEEENDMVDSVDIFAHISGTVNTFKCNYSIHSWV
ncbi:hypothetical protein K2173_021487 [Erythroxylum novogranatense]|uniref:CCT domain-containing protein n=1 Tax=Erythroxylum novogranatense TaxID=1862640 RepID=A0AAV8TQG0_9ROSI|nr:hypothetical protein K2173_021487 [Erythroxylum novogranatense]